MTIAILPMLIETVATGSVAVVAGMAVWYLYKHEKNTSESTNQKNDQTQAAPSTTTPQPQSSSEPVVSSVAETVSSETPQVVKEEIKTAPMPSAVETRVQLSSQEQALRRQQLQDITQMLVATSIRPTDSALSRHYDAMIAAKAEDCLECAAKLTQLQADYAACQNLTCTQTAESSTETCDEEPMLRRHHLHNIRLMLEATTFPRPTDSVLSRHYDEMIDARADDCLAADAKMARLLADYEAYEKSQSAQGCCAAKVETGKAKNCCFIIPEDAMLRRHFLTHLRATIEKNKAPRPTDSALRRHYDAMINAEIENYLLFS